MSLCSLYQALSWLTGVVLQQLRNIIHCWPDLQAAVILRNVRQALGPHSRVLIREFKLFGSAASNSWFTIDDYVIRELSHKQAKTEAATFGTVVVGGS